MKHSSRLGALLAQLWWLSAHLVCPKHREAQMVLSPWACCCCPCALRCPLQQMPASWLSAAVTSCLFLL